jgi:uncharacterized membrane protein HdeD (DUF308 family)
MNILAALIIFIGFTTILAGMAFMMKAFISDKISDMVKGILLVIIGIAIFLVTS